MFLVTGATGFVGSAVVALLHARGHAVRAVVRDPAARGRPARRCGAGGRRPRGRRDPGARDGRLRGRLPPRRGGGRTGSRGARAQRRRHRPGGRRRPAGRGAPPRAHLDERRDLRAGSRRSRLRGRRGRRRGHRADRPVLDDEGRGGGRRARRGGRRGHRRRRRDGRQRVRPLAARAPELQPAPRGGGAGRGRRHRRHPSSGWVLAEDVAEGQLLVHDRGETGRRHVLCGEVASFPEVLDTYARRPAARTASVRSPRAPS